ncbi:hypothetical protein Ciccas_002991 [Cichlidogyrus casuarinus]|uniref:Serpin domain-containing protein n=1 Tax=Cichlidogyrus casuarinus TaxID=1844966 RepID=A0ABD2QFN8_9PLAT
MTMNLTKFVGSLYANTSCKEVNKVLGPGSIYSALLLVLAGADGDTRAELLQAMGIHPDASNDEIHSKASDLFLKEFNKKETSGPELVNANRIYVQNDFPISETYLNHLRSKYQVEAKNFEISSTFDLNETLPKMGVKEAFMKGRANFSKVHANGAQSLFISKVLHKAYLKADEEGAEAAAATAVSCNLSSRIESTPLVVDRPFLVLIINEQKVPLFMGAVYDPSANN